MIIALTTLLLLIVAAAVLLVTAPLGPDGMPPVEILRRRLVARGMWPRPEDVPARGVLLRPEQDRRWRRRFEMAEQRLLGD